MNPNPDPSIAWNVILTIGVLVAIGANVIALVRSNRSQRREVSFLFEPASKEEFDKHARECQADRSAIRAEIIADRRNNEIHASERSKTIHNKMENVRVELDSKIESTRRELSEKIDDMPERVIATLRNTGAI